MIKIFFKFIGFLLMVGIISLATMIFVPDTITQNVKSWSNSAWQQVTSSQSSELPNSGTNE